MNDGDYPPEDIPPVGRPVPKAMVAAVIGAALLALFAVVVSVVNFDRLQADLAQRSHDRDVQVAQAKAQSDAQIAQAKREAAQQVAVAKAQVQHDLCRIAALFPPSPVVSQAMTVEGCSTVGSSSPSPSPSPSGAAVGRGLVSPGPASTTAAPVRPTPTPAPTGTPSPSPSPTTPLLCLLGVCL